MKKSVKNIMLSCVAFAGVVGMASCGAGNNGSGSNPTTEEYNHEVVTLNFGGSTSVEKIAKALTQAFDEECKYFDAVHNHTGSGDAYKRTQGTEKNAATKLDVGFLSRELKSTEAAASNTSGLICKDGIVAVVNSENTLTNVTDVQLKTIYETSSIKWSDIDSSLANANISRYTRDTTSGTRDGFFTAIGFSEAKEDDSVLPNKSIVTSNGDMIAKVKADTNGIGYISLASLAGSGLKALKYKGVTPSEEAVVDGTYGLQRNFNFITRQESDCTESEWDVLEAFMLYMTSREALTIIASKDGILTTPIATAKTWEAIKNENPDVKKLCA